jgi:hypothetical protein
MAVVSHLAQAPLLTTSLLLVRLGVPATAA